MTQLLIALLFMCVSYNIYIISANHNAMYLSQDMNDRFHYVIQKKIMGMLHRKPTTCVDLMNMLHLVHAPRRYKSFGVDGDTIETSLRCIMYSIRTLDIPV
jgi:hypothetical protein